MDNSDLSLHLERIALKAAQYSDGKYRVIDAQKIELIPKHTLEACSSLLDKLAYVNLVDFDNHLDDISQDWMNPDLNKEIDSVL